MDTQIKNLHPEQHEHHNMDLWMAGIAGILAGAASVTALILSDKDIRKKVGKRAQEIRVSLQDWSTEKLHMVDHHKIKTEDTIEKVKEETKEEVPLKQEALRN
jgi:gas vesicle protein